MVANIRGARSHTIIQQGIEVLINLEHRGAECCDPDTGDGSGIMFQVPDAFFQRHSHSLGIALPKEAEYGVGMVFLPQDERQRTECETVIRETVEAEGQGFLGWRDVPVDDTNIGWLARTRAAGHPAVLRGTRRQHPGLGGLRAEVVRHSPPHRDDVF